MLNRARPYCLKFNIALAIAIPLFLILWGMMVPNPYHTHVARPLRRAVLQTPSGTPEMSKAVNPDIDAGLENGIFHKEPILESKQILFSAIPTLHSPLALCSIASRAPPLDTL